MPNRLDLRKIAHFQAKSTRIGSGLAEGEVAILDLCKTPPSPDRILSATNGFSSLNVATATSPSDKTVFARDNSLWERTILRKSSIATSREDRPLPAEISWPRDGGSFA